MPSLLVRKPNTLNMALLLRYGIAFTAFAQSNSYFNFFQGIDFENPLDLGQQAIQQPEVAARDADDHRNRFRIQGLLRELYTGGGPVLLKHAPDPGLPPAAGTPVQIQSGI